MWGNLRAYMHCWLSSCIRSSVFWEAECDTSKLGIFGTWWMWRLMNVVIVMRRGIGRRIVWSVLDFLQKGVMEGVCLCKTLAVLIYFVHLIWNVIVVWVWDMAWQLWFLHRLNNLYCLCRQGFPILILRLS